METLPTFLSIPSRFVKKPVRCSKCPQIFQIIMPKGSQMFVVNALCPTCVLSLKANKHLTMPYPDRMYLEHPYEVSQRRGRMV